MRTSATRCTLRPNRIGLGFIVLAIAMLLAAINYGNNLVFFISFLLIALMGNSAWQTRRQLKSCHVSAKEIPRRFAGALGAWPLVLHSDLNNPAIGVRLDEVDATEALTLSVLVGVPTTVSLPLAPRLRGRHRVPKIILSTHYPIGLWTAQCRLSVPTMIQWVYPKPQGDRPLPQGTGPGSVTSTPHQADTHFDHLRPYTSGDPFNRLAFKQWAKTGQLVTQHWVGEHGDDQNHILDYDRLGGDPEARLEQLAQWIEQLSDQNQLFSLRLPGQADQKGQGPAHRQQCLESLTVFREPPPGSPPLSDAPQTTPDTRA